MLRNKKTLNVIPKKTEQKKVSTHQNAHLRFILFVFT